MFETVNFLPKKKAIKNFLNQMKSSFILIIFLIYALNLFGQNDSDIFLEGTTVTGIAEGDGYLWVATYGQGIYRYSFAEDKWINFSTKTGKLDTDLFYCIEVSKNYVWAGTTEGLFTFNKKRKKWSKRKFAKGGQFGNWIRSLKYDPQQNVLWIGRFRNITRLDVKRRRYADIDRQQGKDQKTNNIKTIALDGDSLIWFGTESGVHIYNKKMKYSKPNAWRYLTNKKRGFKGEGSSVSVSSILFEGNRIWFGTDEFTSKTNPEFNVGGIYIFNRQLDWHKISQVNGLADNGIYFLVRTGNSIWAGVYSFDKKENTDRGRGLFIIDRNTLEIHKVDLNKLKINSSAFITFYFDGKYLWLGSKNGLVRLKIFNPLAVWDSAE